LTIYSKSATLNVNYASPAALLSVPDMTEDLTRSVIQERRKKPFQSLDDLTKRLGTSVPDKALPFLSFEDDSKTYTIVAVGMVDGSQVRRTVKAVVQLAPEGAASHRIIAWYDNAVE